MMLAIRMKPTSMHWCACSSRQSSWQPRCRPAPEITRWRGWTVWPLPVCRLPGGGRIRRRPKRPGGCDKSRGKTKKKEKQNDFLTDTCHSRLGRTSVHLLQIHRRPPALPAGVSSIRFAKRLLQLRAEGSLMLCRSEEHTSELQSLRHLVCRLL